MSDIVSSYPTFITKGCFLVELLSLKLKNCLTKSILGSIKHMEVYSSLLKPELCAAFPLENVYH